MNQQLLPVTSTERVRAFRKRNIRIEYYPSAEAAELIHKMRALNPTLTIGQILDFVIVDRGKGRRG